MSMPQYLEIAVVASNESGFGSIEKLDAVFKPGIAPQYKLVTLDAPKSPLVIHMNRLDHQRIGLWVALDDEAMRRCQAAYQELASRPGYSRGFYDDHLPTAVVQVKDQNEFRALTEKVWEAFCATS
jgi:hypothetical protein